MLEIVDGHPAPAGRDVHVTRHFSLKNETDSPKNQGATGLFIPRSRTKETTVDCTHVEPIPGIFCDWVSIYQAHPSSDLPKINNGAFMRFGPDGDVECTTLLKVRVEGSFESSVFVRCDGTTVHFEGNVSKFGRRENVFGYTFEQCIERINALLGTMGLPPFTPGERFYFTEKHGDHKRAWTGARVTRLDVTQNFAAGCKASAAAFMRHLSMQQASRLKTGTHGDGETVDFGRGSRRVYSKAYLKAAELRKHAKRKKDPQNLNQREYDPYLEPLADWCDSVGLVRFETTYKSTWLIDNGLQYLGGIDMNVIHADFAKRKEVFTRSTLEIDQMADLDAKTLSVYRMWQAGDDLTAKFTKPTFYRHRARLLPYGVDIAIRSNVTRFEPRTRVITLGPCTPPDFYERPHHSLISLVAA